MIRAETEAVGEHDGRERLLCCHGVARLSGEIGQNEDRLPVRKPAGMVTGIPYIAVHRRGED